MSEVENQEVQREEEVQQAPSLTLPDLDAIRNIIDVSCSRGAFRANEMEVVGKLFNKLSAFLASIAPQQENKEESDQPSENTEE